MAPVSGIPSTPPAYRRWVAVLFVGAVWLLMTLAALVTVARYASDVPFADDWAFTVPAVTGERPLRLNWATVDWLWERYPEVPVPLPKLLLAVLCKRSGFHAVIFLSGVILSVLALALILLARSLRGFTSYADAFFPVALLHSGTEAFGYAHMFCNVLPPLLTCTGLMVVARSGTRLTFGAGALAGACVILLTVSHLAGLAYAPALALWLGISGVVLCCSGKSRDRYTGLFVMFLAAIAVCSVGLALRQYERPGEEGYPASPGLWEDLRTAIQFLTMGFGHGREYWPYLGGALLGFLLLDAALLFWALLARPQELVRTLGLLLFLGSAVLLALGVGRARSGFGEMAGLQGRYILLSVPALCGVFLAAEISPVRIISRFVQVSLLLMSVVLLPANMEHGTGFYQSIRDGTEAFERDIAAGMPPSMLAERNVFFLGWNVPAESYPEVEQMLAQRFRELKQAGLGMFRVMRDDYREIPVPVEPVAVRGEVVWEKAGQAYQAVQSVGTRAAAPAGAPMGSWMQLVGALGASQSEAFAPLWKGSGRGLGNDYHLTFALKEPQFVYALRLKVFYEGLVELVDGNPDHKPAALQLRWKKGPHSEFSTTERNAQVELKQKVGSAYPPNPNIRGVVVSILINDTIDQIRIHPDNRPRVFTISEMALIVPAAGAK